MFAEIYHSSDCFGSPACDGCGYIDADGNWVAGPTPVTDAPHQQERAEGPLCIWDGRPAQVGISDYCAVCDPPNEKETP